MLEYCFDHFGLVYEADYLHSSFTLDAGERINLIDFLNQPGWRNVFGLNDAGDFVIFGRAYADMAQPDEGRAWLEKASALEKAGKE
jgi:hypothetical protein